MQEEYVCLVTGGSGLVGKAIENFMETFRKAKNVKENADFSFIKFDGYDENKNNKLFESLSKTKFVFASSTDADLRDRESSKKLFELHKPTSIIHLAAKVGGLFANMNDKINFFLENMHINETVLSLCHEYKVKRGIFCLSTCVFPALVPSLIEERMLHDGPPHHSNEGYAMAKRMLEMLVRFYKEKYEYEWLCVIPTNLFGKFDNFNLQNSHVIPALIHKCYLAKQNNEALTVLGSGDPLRQFVYSSDIAKILIKILISPAEKINFTSVIIAADNNDEHSIRTIAEIIAKCMKLEKPLHFDKSESDGIFKKTASNKLLRSFLGNSFKFTPIEKGIDETVSWFIENYNDCRK